VPINEDGGVYTPQNGDYTMNVSVPVGEGVSVDAHIEFLPGSAFPTEAQVDQAIQTLMDVLSDAPEVIVLSGMKTKRSAHAVTATNPE
jgi:hypothetical protein